VDKNEKEKKGKENEKGKKRQTFFHGSPSGCGEQLYGLLVIDYFG